MPPRNLFRDMVCRLLAWMTGDAKTLFDPPPSVDADSDLTPPWLHPGFRHPADLRFDGWEEFWLWLGSLPRAKQVRYARKYPIPAAWKETALYHMSSAWTTAPSRDVLEDDSRLGAWFAERFADEAGSPLPPWLAYPDAKSRASYDSTRESPSRSSGPWVGRRGARHRLWQGRQPITQTNTRGQYLQYWRSAWDSLSVTQRDAYRKRYRPPWRWRGFYRAEESRRRGTSE